MASKPTFGTYGIVQPPWNDSFQGRTWDASNSGSESGDHETAFAYDNARIVGVPSNQYGDAGYPTILIDGQYVQAGAIPKSHITDLSKITYDATFGYLIPVQYTNSPESFQDEWAPFLLLAKPLLPVLGDSMDFGDFTDVITDDSSLGFDIPDSSAFDSLDETQLAVDPGENDLIDQGLTPEDTGPGDPLDSSDELAPTQSSFSALRPSNPFGMARPSTTATRGGTTQPLLIGDRSSWPQAGNYLGTMYRRVERGQLDPSAYPGSTRGYNGQLAPPSTGLQLAATSQDSTPLIVIGALIAIVLLARG